MSRVPRFLVLDGYSREGRKDLQAGGASTAGELYSRMLKDCTPGGKADVDVVFPADADASLPKGAAIDQYDGIAWTGSSLTVFEPGPFVTPQVEFARAAFEAKVPSFGSCWAAQIAVVAAGGECAPNPRGREMVLGRKIVLTGDGRGHPLYRDKKGVFDAWTSHDDEITKLPPGAQVLASNDFSYVQAVSVSYKGGDFWGLQYHPEFDLHEMARLCYCRREKMINRGFFKDMDAADTFVNDLEALHQDPSRSDLSWRYGIDEDVMNKDIRLREVRNWIDQQVLPRMNGAAV